jgi:hypothetical protein
MKSNLKYKTLAFLIVSAMYAPLSNAVACNENITAVVLHSNGHVYFTTDHTCVSNWCELAWTDSEQLKRGYAMLLSARLSDRGITFDWPNIPTCSTPNVVYASPNISYL